MISADDLTQRAAWSLDAALVWVAEIFQPTLFVTVGLRIRGQFWGNYFSKFQKIIFIASQCCS